MTSCTEEDCPSCSREIPVIETNRQGGCAKCQYASTKYDEFPCLQCAQEETPTIKFPRFKLAKIFKNAFRR